MARKIPHVRPGDPITAGLWNAVTARLERRANVTVSAASGLVMHGRCIAVGPGYWRPIRARLSGSTSPYSWVEVAPTSGGGWSAFGVRSGTNNAYEVNGASGLSGNIQWIHPTAAGDFRFQAIRQGPPKWQFDVNGGCSGSALAGALITLKQGGVTIATCTTGDGTGFTTLGQCIVSVPAGTYDVTIGKTGFTTYSHSLTISGSTTTTVTLSVDPAYKCIACCADPLPSTLYLTDDNGTWALTYDATVGTSGGWVAACSFTSGLVLTCDGLPHPDCYPCDCCGYSYTSGSVAYVYVLTPTGDGSCLELTVYYPVAACVTPGPYSCTQYHGYMPGSSAGTAPATCPGAPSAACSDLGSTWLYMPANSCNGGAVGSLAASTGAIACNPLSTTFSFDESAVSTPTPSASATLST